MGRDLCLRPIWSARPSRRAGRYLAEYYSAPILFREDTRWFVWSYKFRKGLSLVGIIACRRTGVQPEQEHLVRLYDMQRRAAPIPEGDAVASLDNEGLKALTELIRHCAVVKYDDGGDRTPGSFTVDTIGKLWRITLKDPDGCVRLPVIAETLRDAITAATTWLKASNAPWEPDRWAQSRQPKKKK